MQDIAEIDSRKLFVRIVLLFCALAVITATFAAVKWQLGDMLASHTTAFDAESIQISELAHTLAPHDPSSSRLLAETVADTHRSTELLEAAVRQSPKDHRLRVDLGRAYEQDQKYDEAARQFKYAVELAPMYAFSHWHLGNFLLRRGNNDNAVEQLKLAAAANHTYRSQVYSLAWDSGTTPQPFSL